MPDEKAVAAFDFDGTITKKDSFIEFSKFAVGYFRFYLGMTLYSPLILAFLLKIYPSWKAKEKIFAFYFRGMKVERFNQLCEDFYIRNNDKLIKSKAKDAIRRHLENKDVVLIISASVKRVIEPFAKSFGIPCEDVLSTEIATKEGLVTGSFSTPNCKGIEKVNRLLKRYPNRKDYCLIAYGDTSGDKELLAFADEAFYREFE